MNGLYSEAGQEPEWCPASFSNGTQDSVIAAKARVQADTMDRLAKLADMAKRVESMVIAYEEIADAIQEAVVDLNMAAIENDVLFDGIPDWWKSIIEHQRAIRRDLINSYRDLAARVGNEYGVR